MLWKPKRELIKPNRRSFILGAGAAIIVPKLVRAGTVPLMGAGKPGAAASLGLQTNLGSFFSLDDTLADSTGNVTDLTNNGGATFVSSSPTPISAVTKAAKFVTASSQYLSHANATGINVAGIDFSIQIWIYNNLTGFVISKGDGSFANREYILTNPFVTGSADPFRMVLNDGIPAQTSNQGHNAWYHLVVTYNVTTQACIFYLNGSSAATTTGNTPAGTNTLYMAADQSGGTNTTCSLCLFGTWRNRILSASDVTALYNSGNGLSYAGMA